MTVLYEQDYGLWSEQMADLLSVGRDVLERPISLG